MKRNQLEQSNLATQYWSFISKARVVVLAASLVKRLSSMFLMLVFTAFAFVVFAVSVVVVTATSLVGTVLSRAKTPKTGSWQNLLKDESVSPS